MNEGTPVSGAESLEGELHQTALPDAAQPPPEPEVAGGDAVREKPRPYGPLTTTCRGTNRRGEPCGRAPIPGGFVCILHGGKAPQVQQSAKARLLAGADLAIDYLLKLLEPRQLCEHCGRSDADRDPVVVRACQLVLDRSGFHPTLTVEQVAPRNDYADFDEDMLIEKLESMLAVAVARRDAHRQSRNAGAIDAVVDEGFEVPDETRTVPGGQQPIADEPPDIAKENGHD